MLFSRDRGETRQPVVAGMFYPDSPSALRAMINGFMAKAEKRAIDGEILALMVPHAGYEFSGQVAAYAYKQIEGMHFDTIVLIGVSHRAAISGASVYKAGRYETPLGTVEVDSALAEELMARERLFGFHPRADAVEHSLEVQVPFLQVVLSDFKIVPILMGHWSKPVCSAIGDALAETIRGKNVLLIASTDMSHYHPYEMACNMDDVALSSIKRMDMEQLMEDMSSGECELCAAGAVIATFTATRKMGADGVEILKYANSGDVTGDKSGGVVGYFSAAIYRKAQG